MFISYHEVETLVGKELADRLCEWVRVHTPVTCIAEQGHENAVKFDIDDALEFVQIKMRQDAVKREFFPYIVKMKQYKVRAAVRPAASF